MTLRPSIQDPDVVRIVETIKQYLSDHPLAADTLEGVVNWWLLRQRYEIAMDLVSQALEVLVQQGVVSKIKPRGSKTIYKLKACHHRYLPSPNATLPKQDRY